MYPYDPVNNSESTVESADVNATIQLVRQEVAYFLTLPSPYNASSLPSGSDSPESSQSPMRPTSQSSMGSTSLETSIGSTVSSYGIK